MAEDLSSIDSQGEEEDKRRKEWFLISALGVLFLILTWVQFELSSMSASLPLIHTIFLFGLVNFNIILFLLLSYFLFRNIAKSFSENKKGISGRSLKGKLVLAFIGFSFVPTAIMFFASFVYINNFLEKISNEKISSVLQSAQNIVNNDYRSKKTQAYRYAEKMVEAISEADSKEMAESILLKESQRYNIDDVQLFNSSSSKALISLSTKKETEEFPEAPKSFLEKALVKKVNASLPQNLETGTLLRVIIPFKFLNKDSGLVVSIFNNSGYTSNRAGIAQAYEEFRNISEVSHPLKSIFMSALGLITLTLLVFATWFGLHMARQLSIPLQKISIAAGKIAQGKYKRVHVKTGSPEISQLVSDFNQMSDQLSESQHESKEALSRLDEHTKYLKVVLANVSTGVISVNQENDITMVNNYAEDLLGVKARDCINKPASEVLKPEYYSVFEELLESMRKYKMRNIQKEAQVNLEGSRIPLQVTITILTDDNKNELGKVIVFNDLSMVVRAQRAAAWREVARRIAHEIKNPLTPIRLSAQRLQKKFGGQIKDSAFEDCTSMIIDQVDGIKSLVNEFSLFARLPRANFELASLNQILKDALILFEQAHRGVRFELFPDESLPNFMFDTGQIKRVITNLVDNAIAAKEKSNQNFFIEIHVKHDEKNKRVLISVEDNGPGIPAKLRKNIFEPYVTTKSYGTGLGLAIVQRTVEEHRGHIQVLAREPKGARFLIELPLSLTNEKQEQDIVI